jgi:hypothetical protein
MPAAIAVPAIIGGGAALGGAAISAHAAGSASRQQQQAADRALAVEGRIYDEQKARLQPYMQAGSESLNRLMRGYWNNQPYGAALPPDVAGNGGYGAALGAPGGIPVGASAYSQAMGAPTGAYRAAQGPPASAYVGAPASSYAGPMGAYQAAMGAPASANAGQVGQMQAGGDLVMMQGPDGSTRAIPRANVQAAMQRGARVVN